MENDHKRLVESGYDRIAQHYLEFSQRNHAKEPFTARMEYLRKLLDHLSSQAQILELGCGAGFPCTQLLAQRGHVTGVDISAAQIALAQQLVPEATLLQADMLALTFPPTSFDAVTAFYSLIHLHRSEQATLISRLTSWLRPGGWFLGNFGTTNDPGSIEADWLGAPMYWSSYDTRTNLDLVRQAGLTLLETEVRAEQEDGVAVPFLWILAQKA